MSHLTWATYREVSVYIATMAIALQKEEPGSSCLTLSDAVASYVNPHAPTIRDLMRIEYTRVTGAKSNKSGFADITELTWGELSPEARQEIRIQKLRTYLTWLSARADRKMMPLMLTSALQATEEAKSKWDIAFTANALFLIVQALADVEQIAPVMLSYLELQKPTYTEQETLNRYHTWLAGNIGASRVWLPIE